MADCPSCGERLTPKAKFCDYCGEKLPEDSQEAGASSAPVSKKASKKASRKPPISRDAAFVGIGMGIVLTILTCGFYMLFWQARQFRVLNAWLGRKEYGFWSWYFYGLFTCSVYWIYHEYKMANGICEIQHKRGWPENPQLAVICLLLSACGLSVASMAIQQEEINKFYQQS